MHEQLKIMFGAFGLVIIAACVTWFPQFLESHYKTVAPIKLITPIIKPRIPRCDCATEFGKLQKHLDCHDKVMAQVRRDM